MYQDPQNKAVSNYPMGSGKSTALPLMGNRIKIPVLQTLPKNEISESVFQMKFKRREQPSVEYTASTPEEEFLLLAEFLHDDDPEFPDLQITVEQIVTVLKEIEAKSDSEELADYEIKDEVVKKYPLLLSSSTAAAASTSAKSAAEPDDEEEGHTQIPEIGKLSEKISGEDATNMHLGKQKGLPQWLPYVHSRNNPDLLTDRKGNFYVRLDIVVEQADQLFEKGMKIVESKSGYYGFVCSI